MMNRPPPFVKAIERPSGEYAGMSLPPPPCVSRVGGPPLAGTVQISCVRENALASSRAAPLLEYAIVSPSGDQLGHWSMPRANVSCVRPDPSAFITKICPFENAMRDPSGDH